MRYISCIPAYGRDYKSKKEVMEAWNSGKDFLMQDMFEQRYISNTNPNVHDVTLNIRYKKLTQVCVVVIK